ncbi:hypothetical protein Pan189_12400 [Stratiformator vulcanicus]|uniref:Uncharacterized protein n=1 Tax=Stratiformator vulcanicus TaxID=2527980 RepID=A0A517QYZ8_9PLAN|nr:hypothetical protein Pan189_12400 [Stratiformator vulcanicus]
MCLAANRQDLNATSGVGSRDESILAFTVVVLMRRKFANHFGHFSQTHPDQFVSKHRA